MNGVCVDGVEEVMKQVSIHTHTREEICSFTNIISRKIHLEQLLNV